MPAKDIYHNEVKNALIKDGWTITDDPFTEPEYKLYLAVDDVIYENFFQRKSVQAVINENNLLLIVVNTEKEEIRQWISSNNIAMLSRRH